MGIYALHNIYNLYQIILVKSLNLNKSTDSNTSWPEK